MAATAGAAPLLAQARHRAGEPDRDGAVEQPDVDPQLERVRRRHAEELPLDQAPLDLAPLRGRVAGPVRREPGGSLRVEAVDGEAVDELGRLAALREADRPQAARDELGQQPRPVAERARPQLQRLVEHRRVPERDRPGGPRGRVVLDHRGVGAQERAGQLARVGDGGRGEEELRVGAVDLSSPAQAPEDVPDVRAEHAPVDVRLVDDHVAEVREHVSPAVVVREDADVEHVRVREDHVRPLADLPAPLVLGVAVVDGRLDARNAKRGQRPRLVLCQGLRGVEVEGPHLRLGGERVEDGEVEREGLPAGRAGRDDQMLAAARGRERLGLVGEELGDPGRPQGALQLGVELGERHETRLAPRNLRQVRELLALEHLRPGHGGHPHDANFTPRWYPGASPSRPRIRAGERASRQTSRRSRAWAATA